MTDRFDDDFKTSAGITKLDAVLRSQPASELDARWLPCAVAAQ